MSNKLKRNQQVIFINKDNINRILNGIILSFKYKKRDTLDCAEGDVLIKYRTAKSKLLYEMYYEEIKKTAFELAVENMWSETLNTLNRRIVSDLYGK